MTNTENLTPRQQWAAAERELDLLALSPAPISSEGVLRLLMAVVVHETQRDLWRDVASASNEVTGYDIAVTRAMEFVRPPYFPRLLGEQHVIEMKRHVAIQWLRKNADRMPQTLAAFVKHYV